MIKYLTRINTNKDPIHTKIPFQIPLFPPLKKGDERGILIRGNSCLKAQSLLSYVFLTAVVVAALLAMSNFIRYSIQGRFRQAADVFGGGEQYELGLTQVTP